jgi:hypothetical protein
MAPQSPPPSTKSLFLAVFIGRSAGEILPQAVCSRYGLAIGGMAAPVVRFLMWFTAPISWPIGKALDAILGHEQPTFGKRQISALVDLHRWVGNRPGCAVPVQLGPILGGGTRLAGAGECYQQWSRQRRQEPNWVRHDWVAVPALAVSHLITDG